MPVSEKLQRLHMSLSIGASTVAIIATVISAMTYVKTENLQKLFDETRKLELRLTLTSPTSGAELQGTPTPWSGQAEIRPYIDTIYKGNVTLELAERGIQVVPFVRPVSSENLWWA